MWNFHSTYSEIYARILPECYSMRGHALPVVFAVACFFKVQWNCEFSAHGPEAEVCAMWNEIIESMV